MNNEVPYFGSSNEVRVIRRHQGSPRPFLVFFRANGTPRNFLYPALLASPRNFDVAICYYDNRGQDQAVYAAADYILTGGLSKYHAAKRFLESEGGLDCYQGFMFPDEDLEFPEAEVSRFLQFCLENRIDLAQPSLSPDSFFSWKITLNHPSFHWRDTNFVEPMTPYMSNRAIRQLLHTFDESISAWGLDLIWPHLLRDSRIGIADCFMIRHLKAVDVAGEGFYKHLANLGIRPQEELVRLLKKYGIDNVPVQTTGVSQVDTRIVLKGDSYMRHGG